jgi:quercetin dioxygenase-like cupin family protein
MRSPSRGNLCVDGRPHTTSAGGLIAVGPNVAKLLAAETLRQDVIGLVSLYLDRNVAEA